MSLFDRPSSRRAFLGRTLLGLVILACIPRLTFADSPSTQPAATIEAGLVHLSDSDPSIREAAREQLMGLSAGDLPALKLAIAQHGPLAPEDVDALQDVVMHVYLTGENADGNPEQGFMGVMMRDQKTIYSEDDDDTNKPLGVIVYLRVPGLAAYRALRNGDVILSIATDDTHELRVRAAADIMSTVAPLPAGARVKLQVLRRGRKIDTSLILNARPRVLDPNQAQFTFDRYCQIQQEKAQAYWTSNFAPLIEKILS